MAYQFSQSSTYYKVFLPAKLSYKPPAPWYYEETNKAAPKLEFTYIKRFCCGQRIPNMLVVIGDANCPSPARTCLSHFIRSAGHVGHLMRGSWWWGVPLYAKRRADGFLAYNIVQIWINVLCITIYYSAVGMDRQSCDLPLALASRTRLLRHVRCSL